MSINPKIKDRASPLTPAGAGKRTWLAALEQGANLLQTTAPLKNFDVYVVGFHCAKGEPDFQMEAHHFSDRGERAGPRQHRRHPHSQQPRQRVPHPAAAG